MPGVNYVAEGFTRGELRRKILDGFATVGKKDQNGPRPPYRMPGWAGQMSDREVADLVDLAMQVHPERRQFAGGQEFDAAVGVVMSEIR